MARKPSSRIARIQRQVARMDLICSGTLLKRTKVCGKPNCRCARDPDAEHGPYYEWKRRENNRLRQEIAILIEEARIKDSRMDCIPAQRRPHYPPIERMAISRTPSGNVPARFSASPGSSLML